MTKEQFNGGDYMVHYFTDPPEFEVISSEERVRRGQRQILICEPKGDMPMKISWTKQSPIQVNPRLFQNYYNVSVLKYNHSFL